MLTNLEKIRRMSVEGVVHSIKKLFPNTTEINLMGQCTDSGGGGTKFALRRELWIKLQ